MPVIGVKNFIGERLTQARNARGLTSANLAALIGVSPASISLYESGKQNPKQEVVDKLAATLNVPVTLFFKQLFIERPANLFYRSMSSATKMSRVVSEAKYEWALEIVDYLLEYFDFPIVNLPKLEIPADFRQLTSFQIETAATHLRENWTLGVGPITNMVRTLESNGIVTWRTLFEAETQDAFSEFRYPHPLIVLSTDKNNYFRSRFDAAHELGHLILHRSVDRNTINNSSDHNQMEGQAHLFAAAFLLPATQFLNETWDISLDSFRALKPRWNVSIGMQIMRALQLNIISKSDAQKMWVNMSRRKWRKNEPLDDCTPTEKPSLIIQSIKMLVDSGRKTKEQLIADLSFSSTDIENIIEEIGYFNDQQSSLTPTFKDPSNNVFPFRKAKA